MFRSDGQGVTRRQALQSAACGFCYLALAGMTGCAATVDPLALRQSHFAPRAKRIIFLFMAGGPSQVDTFDYKAVLEQQDGQQREFSDARVLAKTGQIVKHRVMKSPWKF